MKKQTKILNNQKLKEAFKTSTKFSYLEMYYVYIRYNYNAAKPFYYEKLIIDQNILLDFQIPYFKNLKKH